MDDEQDTPIATRFTLRRGQWYAAEFIGDQFHDELRSYSPIRVDAIEPCHDGHRNFHLSFHHANYPEGVQGKRYLLRTRERGERFILARRSQDSSILLLLIYDISWPWLRMHFGIQQPGNSSDIGRWLSNHF